MIVDVKIDFSEILEDQDLSLKDIVIHEIKRQAVNQVNTQSMERVKTLVSDYFENTGEEIIKDQIKRVFDEQILKGTTMGRRLVINDDGDSEWVDNCTIEQYVKTSLHDTRSYGSLGATLTKLAQETADQIRNRVDMNLATQIVHKMAENNLLKEEVVQSLIDKK